MKIEKNSIIGEIVASDYRTAAVFETFGIDFCCKGGRSVSEACALQNTSEDILITKLHDAMNKSADQLQNFASWPADLLVDYIEKKHHRYVEETIPVLNRFLEKIASVHGKNHPELIKIKELFKESAGALTMHMKKEELILFPFIRRTFKGTNQQRETEVASLGTVADPVKKMMEEHDTEGERFREIKQLSNNYTAPEDGCATYQAAMKVLQEFENDLHLHIHLENNILFPKAIALEKHKIYESTN